MNINYSRLPQHMQHTARLYIEKGIQGGSFFTAVASNDLFGAFNRADDINAAAMQDWVRFFYNDAPTWCWGSPDKVAAWIASGGMSAARKKEAAQ